MQIFDLSKLLASSTSKILVKNFQNKGKLLGIKLNHFSGLVGRELQPHYRLGTEFSGRAKIKAGVGGIFHSDELPNYGISAEEVEKVRKELECTLHDAFILVADAKEKARSALTAVYERAQETYLGVPAEVRKAHPDGTTSYLRPMPGASRMYPETDIPLIWADLKNVEVPESLEEKMIRYQKKLGLSKDLAVFIAKSEQMNLFEDLVKKYPQMKAAFIAETLTSTPLEISRNYGLDGEKITEENFRQLFQYLSEDKIHKDIVLDVLLDMLQNKFDLKKYATLSTEAIHQIIKEIIEKNKGANFSALMGHCMKALSGKASGKVISDSLKIILENGHK